MTIRSITKINKNSLFNKATSISEKNEILHHTQNNDRNYCGMFLYSINQ